eukprot:g18990.t1
MVASSSSTTVVSQVVKFERILRASGQDPYPVSLEKVECFLAVGVASGYRTLDDDLSMICSRAKKAGNFDLSQVEESYMSSLLSSLRRKGFFNHDQKRPAFRRDILALSCRRTRASLLLVFYFGLRKSEASQVNSTIKVLWGEKSIGLDLRGAILKSNSTAAIRVRCFCDSCPEACLHTYWAQIEALSGGIDVVQCLAKLDAGSDTATHSFRVGLVVTLFEAGYTNVQIEGGVAAAAGAGAASASEFFQLVINAAKAHGQPVDDSSEVDTAQKQKGLCPEALMSGAEMKAVMKVVKGREVHGFAFKKFLQFIHLCAGLLLTAGDEVSKANALGLTLLLRYSGVNSEMLPRGLQTAFTDVHRLIIDADESSAGEDGAEQYAKRILFWIRTCLCARLDALLSSNSEPPGKKRRTDFPTRSKDPCVYHLKFGNCSRGDACKFSHPRVASKEELKKLRDSKDFKFDLEEAWAKHQEKQKA